MTLGIDELLEVMEVVRWESERILKKRGFEPASLEHRDVILLSHSPVTCYGETCTLHNRSDHSMREFPQHWRSDRGIMERICPHGQGHPDPDDYRVYSGADPGVHNCDGCCLTDEQRAAWDEGARIAEEHLKRIQEKQDRDDIERMEDEGWFI